MIATAKDLSPPQSPAAELLDGHSIEITSKDSAELAKAGKQMDADTRISITFLPKESFEKRLAAVEEVLRVGMKPVPHISARRIASSADLENYLRSLAAIGACEEVFVVAGDPDTPDGPYEDALAVIRSGLLERFGVRHVGIGGYPEGHPKIGDDLLWQALRDKTAALSERGMGMSILTQFGFNTDPVIAWLEQLRTDGFDAPVRLGIPGPASAATLMRFAARCGVAASGSVLARYGLSLTKLMQSTGPDTYVTDLANRIRPDVHGDVGLHFYPFGGLVATTGWIRQFAEKQTARRG